MAEEIGALRAVLALESAAFDKGVASARRQLGAMDGSLQRTGGQVVQFGSRMRDIDRGSRSASGGLQNIGFQVQDFAVQVGAGTSASQALAQQLPQLLSGFGLLGIALGTASAIAIPLAGIFFDVGKGAKSSADSLKDMDASVKALQETSAVYTSTGLVQQIEKYGELNAAVLLLIERQRQLTVDQAMTSARDAVAGLSATFDTLFSTRRGEIADLLGVEASVRQIDNFGNAIRTVNPQVREFESALAAVSTAATFTEQADAIATVLTLLDGTAEKGGEYYNTLVQSESAMRQLAAAGAGVNGWLDGAISGASTFAAKLWDAAAAAFSIGSAAPTGADTVYSGRGEDPRNFTAGRSNTFDKPLFTIPAPPRGGGGGGAAQKEANDLQREAARVFAQTRTEAEKYGVELGKLNTLLAAGEISQDTFNRAVDELKDKAGEAGSAAQSMESAFSSAFTSFVTGAESARDAVSNLLASLADTLANEAFSALSKGLFGDGGIGGVVSGALGLNANGNAFSNGRVTAFAAGGVVNSPTVFPIANGAGLMGEAGPEAIMPLTRVGGKLGVRSAGGGAPVINIDARGAVEGTDVRIAKALRDALPGFTQTAVLATKQAAARGRL